MHKVRPILNIVKKKLGKYATLGTEHSFDEATMACCSSYGRHLITLNAKKPTGKFHFKLYMLCCATTNLTHKTKIHTRDNSDRDELVENTENEEVNDEIVSKIDALTLNMCNGLYNHGCTVNMDNYYMSTTCAIRLRQSGVLCRGTIRSSRKFVPKSILFSRSEVRTLPRGTQRIAVNRDNNMLAIGWIDNKAVHFISTADSTKVVSVNQRIRRDKM